MKLQKLAKKVVDTYGLLHQTHLGVLRHYIKTTSEEALAKEISKITSHKELRTLWEAGLNTYLQDEVLKRLKAIE